MCQTSSTLRALRLEALDIYRNALNSVKVDLLVRNAVRWEDDHLVLGCHQPTGSYTPETRFDLKLYSPHVIGGGKSVLGMACELARISGRAHINQLFSHGLISLPGGMRDCMNEKSTLNLLDSIKVKCFFGSETNLPNKDSVNASEMILEEVDKACREDKLNGRIPLFIVLLSGGGSSCLTSPRYISLDEKLKLINFLVQKGADIVEMNKVRRFFSKIKGGKLARRILTCEPQSKVISLILSDVIGDPVEFIASGPTFLDDASSHESVMVQVLHKHGYYMKPYHVEAETDLDIGSVKNTTNYIIGNNTIALNAAIEKARELGYQVKNLGNSLNGPTETVLKSIVDSSYQDPTCAGKMLKSKTLVIGGGEATINKLESDSWGKGGRGQEMALDFLINDLQVCPPGTVRLFLAGSTDGQDGPTDVAACLASVADKSSQYTYTLQNLLETKRSHDSFNFFTGYHPDWLIKTGLTGTNVMDLYMLLSSPFNYNMK